MKYANTNLMKINDEIWLDKDEFFLILRNRHEILEKFDSESSFFQKFRIGWNDYIIPNVILM